MTGIAPNRYADYSTKEGTHFWFREMLYSSSSTGFKRIYAVDGVLRISPHKRGVFKAHVQEAFKKWAITEAERIMIDE